MARQSFPGRELALLHPMLRKAVRPRSGLLLCDASPTRSKSGITHPGANGHSEAAKRRVSLFCRHRSMARSASAFTMPKGNSFAFSIEKRTSIEFKIGADALSTTWDGKNDSGEDVPAGKYRAHGFVVGDLKVEGVGFFFNDWITTDDSSQSSASPKLGNAK